MDNKKRMDNRGISILEMVVVMAIIVVVCGVMVWGLGALIAKPAEQCAKQFEISLEKHRVTAMGKGSASMKLYVENGKIMIQETIDGVPKPATCIGAKGVTVKYKKGSTYSELNSTGITIQFKRSTGELEKIVESSSSYYIKEFEFSKGDMTKKLTIVPLTGKVTIE